MYKRGVTSSEPSEMEVSRLRGKLIRKQFFFLHVVSNRVIILTSQVRACLGDDNKLLTQEQNPLSSQGTFVN